MTIGPELILHELPKVWIDNGFMLASIYVALMGDLAYGADPARHTSLGLVTCDQDDSTYVALDEATKHAAVDVVFARCDTSAAKAKNAAQTNATIASFNKQMRETCPAPAAAPKKS